MNALHPRLRHRLRATNPLPLPPPPPGLADRVLALARRDPPPEADVAPEPFLAVVLGMALAVAVAGLVFGSLPGQGTGPAPDFIEASQFAFTQLLP
ncbi:MAG: hypothetical protein WCR07_11215 [Verrucomicrobiota bacterium]